MATERKADVAMMVLLAAGVLSGCGSQPRSEYPLLEPSLASDAALDCAGLDDQLLKANALRDAIYAEHGDVMGGAVVATAVDVAAEPVTGVLFGMLAAASASKASKKYLRAATAAEQRMEALLADKAARTCTSGPTEDPDMTDSLVLGALQEKKALFKQKHITQQQYDSERRKLLDELR